MTTHTRGLFEALEDIHRRPAPFSAYTAPLLWTDEHIAHQMLAFHLDPESAPASRPHAFIHRSAAWITRHFDLGSGARVADFGCGPGLYTSRLAAAGARVTGIDFSPVSIAHARRQADRQGLAIDYIQANYLEWQPTGSFDLITLIYCDLCPLAPEQRRNLLITMRDALAEGGSILLDVFTMAAFAGRQESAEHGRNLMNGFWAAGDYWGFRDTFKYQEQQVVLDRYTIVEPGRTRTVFNWLQYFTPEQLKEEFASCGLMVTERYADVAGAPFAGGEVLAVVARRA